MSRKEGKTKKRKSERRRRQRRKQTKRRSRRKRRDETAPCYGFSRETQTLLGDLSGMQFIRSCSLRTGQWEGVVLEVESGVLVLRTVVSGVLILGVVECGVPVVPGSRNVI